VIATLIVIITCGLVPVTGYLLARRPWEGK